MLDLAYYTWAGQQDRLIDIYRDGYETTDYDWSAVGRWWMFTGQFIWIFDHCGRACSHW